MPIDSSRKVSKIIDYCKSGSLLNAIQLLKSLDPAKIGSKPILYASLLQSCNKVHSLNHGLQFHAHVIKSGLDTDRFVGNSLLTVYFKLNHDIAETRRVFNSLFFKDVISWTSMISGYVQVGKFEDSLEVFWEMLETEIGPNAFTLSAVIKACSELGNLRLGSCFHGAVFRYGFDSNAVIASAIIDMYGRNYCSSEARKLFDELLVPDLICWTSVISALTRNDQFEEALEFFFMMQRIHNHELKPDSFTFGTVLTACGNLGRLKQGKQIHSKVVTSGFSGHVVVDSSLVDMYGKCKALSKARLVFDRMPQKNKISRTALLGVYCQNNNFETVIQLFRDFGGADLYSFGIVLKACSAMAAVNQGKEIHCQYVRRGGWRDVITESALVYLYAKSGCIDFAYRIFVRMPFKNLITWNSMIYGFAQNGRGTESILIFDSMIKDGVKPDAISFIGVLFACSHSGLVNEGRKYFGLMLGEFGMEPGIMHYNCMVDLLGRAGSLEEAEDLLEKSKFRNDLSLWSGLLGACTTCTEPTTAERIAKKVMELDPKNHMSYVLLGNVYRSVGRWDDALEVRRLMDDRKVRKMTGRSWM